MEPQEASIQQYGKLYKLRPLKGHVENKIKIFGFDVETYHERDDIIRASGKVNMAWNQKFLLGCVYSADSQQTFRDAKEMRDFLLSRNTRDSMVFATNLEFDLGVLFPDMHEKFKIIYRHKLLGATKIEQEDRFKQYKNERKNYGQLRKWTFCDTLNYLPVGVEKLGQIVGIPKMEKPKTMEFHKEALGILSRKPENEQEWKELGEYCMNDAKITYLFAKTYKEFCTEHNMRMKLTLASCGIDFWRRNYQKQIMVREPANLLQKHFLGSFRGGMTVLYKRGVPEGSIYGYDINCYSDDTELLTSNGWKKYTDISKEDIVYGMNDDCIEEQRINDIIIKDYSGDMINLTNENTDQLVTPNHRVYLKQYNRTKWHKDNGNYGRQEWSVVDAKDVPKTYVKFPNAFPHCCKGVDISDDMIRLMAWYITEGCRIGNTIEISQSWSHNPHNCYHILEILKRLNIEYRRHDRIQKGKEYLYIRFSYNIIASAFKHSEHLNSYTMMLPADFMQYSFQQKFVLFEELMRGDGSYQDGKTSYYSFSNILLDSFQTLCTLIGFKSSINNKNHACYVKRERDGTSSINVKNGKRVVSYNGKVWCVSVPLKNIVVRRNGKVFISGNSCYPHAMVIGVDGKGGYPNPSSFVYKNNVTTEQIENYDGITKCTVHMPYMYCPPLGIKSDDGKLIFPVGIIKDYWFTNFELRKAMDLGAEVYPSEGIYYTENFEPFKDAATDLYNLRIKYGKEHYFYPMVKTLMNSGLFGRWGMNFNKMEEIFSSNSLCFDDNGNAYRMENGKKELLETYNLRELTYATSVCVRDYQGKPQKTSFPILSEYTTAIARINLWNLVHKYEKYLWYSDTDSSYMSKPVFESDDKTLGAFKLECTSEDAVFAAPKFYRIDDKCKSKGVGKFLSNKEVFDNTLRTKSVDVLQWQRLKSAWQNNRTMGTIFRNTKNFKFDDSKRDWHGQSFANSGWQDSEPLNLTT